MRVGATAVAAVLVAVVIWAVTRPATSKAGNLVGEQAPAWSGKVSNGPGTLSSASEHGHWVVLNFFATWCGPCQRETPALVGFAAEHAGSSSVRLVGVVYQDSSGAVQSFARSHGVRWPILEDPGGDIASAYSVFGLPESIVIAPDGRVADRFAGGVTVGLLDQAVGSGGR